DLVARAVAQGGVGPQPVEDPGLVGGAEQAPADLGVLPGQPVELVEADPVDLVGAQVVDGGVAADEVAVEGGPRALQPAQAGPVVGPGGGEQLRAEVVAVAVEGGPDHVPGGGGQVGPPAGLPVPARRAGQGDEGVALRRRGQVLLHLVERPLDVDAGGGPPGGQAGPQPLDHL